MKFPPLENTDEDGLLCLGGDLSIERLQLAYQQGIFPWYNEGEPIQWYSPDPRFVLFLDAFKPTKSLQQLMKSSAYSYTMNTCFDQVIHACQNVKRKHQFGTWITEEMKMAYCKLHQLGQAHSVECWYDNKLVGGLYGILLPHVFCGESMFSHVPNASKLAFAFLVSLLKQKNIVLIDCQVYTAHLESLGAQMISRDEYMKIVQYGLLNS